MLSHERRRHQRIVVRPGALALIDNIPGSIIDISEGGLALHHMVFSQEPRQVFRIDLFLQPDMPPISGLPAELVNEPDLPGAAEKPTAVQFQRYGLRFGELTDNQRQQLKYFILHNTLSFA